MKRNANSSSKPLHKHQPSSAKLPSPSSNPSSSPSTETLSQLHASLTPTLPVLQAVAHRHRNQHSASHWWAAFGLLRRAARNLATALLRRSRRIDHDLPAVIHAKWMARHVVPRAYIAFTQLAADNQHAPLGLMLLGILARINSLLSNLVPSDHASESTSTPATVVTLDPASSSARPDEHLDMGVAVSRDELAIPKPPSREPDRVVAKEPSSKEGKAKKLAKSTADVVKDTPGNIKEKKKKKKKGGDALSSLFGSL
ncbi:hypothetical protein G7Z17_g9796 [Cylindrodendrum hubeiense]|uniref:RNase MRP protein 1 RNA binding domain-containing protein n=1 Tax=Cylindrodendrum hubeiense TaxID=595255 RepID=A0A9P5H3V3_9HYPO|nr:hypothetical protein G7Z17_g9796 [Cylindrodendrum hubeiense]